MQSFQKAKVITDSICRHNKLFNSPAGGINEHHTESSPPNWKRRCNQPELFFFSRNFLCKKLLFGLQTKFFHFDVENGEEQQKHPLARKACGRFVSKFHGNGGSGGGGGGGGDGGDALLAPLAQCDAWVHVHFSIVDEGEPFRYLYFITWCW